MVYRDDRVGLRIEIDTLRHDLEDSQNTVARLLADPRDRGWLRELTGGQGITLERRVAASLSDRTMGEVVDALSTRFGTTGEVSQVGRRLAWSLPKTLEHTRNLEVTLIEREGSVDVRIRERVARLGVIGYPLSLSFAILFGMATLSAVTHLPSLAMVTPIFVLTVLLTWLALHTWHRRRLREMLATMESVQNLLVAQTAPTPLRIENTAALAEAMHDDEALAEEEQRAAVSADRRRTRP